jgi:hypothetical protein
MDIRDAMQPREFPGHTPGPWANPEYEDCGADRGWWINNGLAGSDEYAVAVTFALNPKDEADAKLIAAAPDLLAANKVLQEEVRVLAKTLERTQTEPKNARLTAKIYLLLNQLPDQEAKT